VHVQRDGRHLEARVLDLPRPHELQLLEGSESNAPLFTQAQRTELDRRLDRLMQNPGRTIPWEDVRRELEREE